MLNDELDRVRTDSRTSGHSRMESTTSLLSTNESRHSTNQRSFFDTLASKFSGMSLHKKYQSGTTKSPDYKRVQVVPSDIDAKFAVDGGDLPMPVARQHGRELSGDDVLERRSTLPSVLDIRAPSVAGSQRGRALRNDSLPTTNDGRTDYAPRTVFQSDYSLGTTDLMTPISPSGSDPSEHLRSVRAVRLPSPATVCLLDTDVTRCPGAPRAGGQSAVAPHSVGPARRANGAGSVDVHRASGVDGLACAPALSSWTLV